MTGRAEGWPEAPGFLPEQRRIRGAILGGGIVAVLVLGALGYFYLDRDVGEPVASRSEQASPRDVAVAPPAEEARQPPSPQATAPAPSAPPLTQAPSITAAPSAPGMPSASSGAETPAAETPAAETQAPATAPIESAQPAPAPPDSMRDQPASLPADEVVFVQRPRVNIRSAPSLTGRIVGSAARGQQFKVVSRSGSWVQIEGDSGTGWISGSLLGPQSP